MAVWKDLKASQNEKRNNQDELYTSTQCGHQTGPTAYWKFRVSTLTQTCWSESIYLLTRLPGLSETWGSLVWSDFTHYQKAAGIRTLWDRYGNRQTLVGWAGRTHLETHIRQNGVHSAKQGPVFAWRCGETVLLLRKWAWRQDILDGLKVVFLAWLPDVWVCLPSPFPRFIRPPVPRKQTTDFPVPGHMSSPWVGAGCGAERLQFFFIYPCLSPALVVVDTFLIMSNSTVIFPLFRTRLRTEFTIPLSPVTLQVFSL